MSPAFSPPPSLPPSCFSSHSYSLCLPLSPSPPDSPHSSFAPSLPLFSPLYSVLAHSNGPRPGTLGAQEIRWELCVCVWVCVWESTHVYLCFHLCLWAHMSVYSRGSALRNKTFFFFFIHEWNICQAWLSIIRPQMGGTGHNWEGLYNSKILFSFFRSLKISLSSCLEELSLTSTWDESFHPTKEVL